MFTNLPFSSSTPKSKIPYFCSRVNCSNRTSCETFFIRSFSPKIASRKSFKKTSFSFWLKNALKAMSFFYFNRLLDCGVIIIFVPPYYILIVCFWQYC